MTPLAADDRPNASSRATLASGKSAAEPGKMLPKRKLRDVVKGCILAALGASFSPWPGGVKALGAATERSVRTAYNYLHGRTEMSAVDLVLAAVRCPFAWAELRAKVLEEVPSAEHIAAEAPRPRRSLAARAVDAARRVSFRLRFRPRRRAEVA